MIVIQQPEARAMSSDYGIDDLPERPDARVSVREAFMIDTDAVAPAFARRTLHVPPIDSGLSLRSEHDDGDSVGLRRQ